MLLTPVVYMPPSSGFLGALMQINPLSSLIVATRDLLLVGATSLLPQAAAIFSGTLVLLFLGWVLYRLAMPILIERIGN
jgi:lipopolysaccharide transport system permease protein